VQECLDKFRTCDKSLPFLHARYQCCNSLRTLLDEGFLYLCFSQYEPKFLAGSSGSRLQHFGDYSFCSLRDMCQAQLQPAYDADIREQRVFIFGKSKFLRCTHGGDAAMNPYNPEFRQGGHNAHAAGTRRKRHVRYGAIDEQLNAYKSRIPFLCNECLGVGRHAWNGDGKAKRSAGGHRFKCKNCGIRYTVDT
jgi:hypothetical protein